MRCVPVHGFAVTKPNVDVAPACRAWAKTALYLVVEALRSIKFVAFVHKDCDLVLTYFLPSYQSLAPAVQSTSIHELHDSTFCENGLLNEQGAPVMFNCTTDRTKQQHEWDFYSLLSTSTDPHKHKCCIDTKLHDSTIHQNCYSRLSKGPYNVLLHY